MRAVRRLGPLAAIVYAALTLASYSFYPQSFSPLHNWLSDLGNTLVNTRGAILYNIGCAVTAILLVIYYVGLNALRTRDRVLGRLLSIGQASGIFASLALSLAAIFNIGTHPLWHSRFSMLLCIGLTWFLSFTSTALLRHPGFKKWVGIFGFVAAAVTFGYGVFFNTPLAEWITIGSFIVYLIAAGATTGASSPVAIEK